MCTQQDVVESEQMPVDVGMGTCGHTDTNADLTSLTLWMRGCSQSVLTSQWLSRKVRMVAEATLAPRTRERINPGGGHRIITFTEMTNSITVVSTLYMYVTESGCIKSMVMYLTPVKEEYRH